MPDPRDYKLDLSSTAIPELNQDAGKTSSPIPQTSADQLISPATAKSARPFLSVQFACCGVYQRVYLSTDGTHYPARCPKCAKATNFRVGPGGTNAREFIVT